MTEEKAVQGIPVGISSCLLGERVRYDGGHKAHSYIMKTLGDYFEFRQFCPELAIGLGIPRKPIRLVRMDGGEVRCQGINDDSIDVTEELQACAREQLGWVQELCGYIFKKDSPSCGMERVKVWGKGMPVRDGAGLYAATLAREVPYLPLEEEGRLGDSGLRENFIQRVFTLHRWRLMIAQGLTVKALMAFHANHKLIVMGHDQQAYRDLGRLIAGTNRENLEENSEQYLLQLMLALKKVATRGNHVNVLQHVQGYLKKHLDGDDKQELVEAIQAYKVGQLPLIVPITLLNHHFRKHPDPYIADSWYMHPYPQELKLRNEI